MLHLLKNIVLLPIIILVATLSTIFAEDIPCALKSVGPGNNICVCNATYCDKMGPIELPHKGEFITYISTKQGLRMNKSSGTFQPTNNKEALNTSDSKIKAHVMNISVNPDYVRQKVLGFGGAFTDAAGINIRDLPEDLQKTLMNSYYGPEGIGYSLGRIPMAGTDFSTRPYTYDDNKGDTNLTKFALQEEDRLLKIPFIKMALSLTPDLLLYGTPWTAPPWMKTNNDFKGRGILKPEYYQVWADYFVKFLKAYEEEGLKMWGISAQNEPIDGLFPYFPFNSMGWTPSRQKNFIKNNLGPTLHANGYQDLKVMIMDDNTILLPIWPGKLLSDPDTEKYISGIAIHWYTNEITKYCGINQTFYTYPDKFILGTEACEGFFPWQKKVELGSWSRGESYAEDIIRDLDNGVIGWTDWNLALDLVGGPNWANLGADSPILVNKTGQEFYKQPMFYAMAHVSKFFLRDSQIIQTVTTSLDKTLKANLHVVGALRPDHGFTIALLNKNEVNLTINIKDDERGTASFILPSQSFCTLLYS